MANNDRYNNDNNNNNNNNRNNEYDRNGYTDNNFDRNFDSNNYNVRGGRDYREEYRPDNRNDNRNDTRNGYNNGYNNQARGNQPPMQNNSNQRGRGYDNNDQYRPIEDIQIQERAEVKQPPRTTDNGASDILVSYPKTYQEVKQLIDSLRASQAVIIDIIKLDPADAQRVLDFMSGANYALGGSMQRLSGTMFVFTPGGVSIKKPYNVKGK